MRTIALILSRCTTLLLFLVSLRQPFMVGLYAMTLLVLAFMVARSILTTETSR